MHDQGYACTAVQDMLTYTELDRKKITPCKHRELISISQHMSCVVQQQVCVKNNSSDEGGGVGE